MALSYFCPHCGAEHAPNETLCRACQHPLDAPNTTAHASTLLNERYEVLVEVGSGGFGAVYKARDTHEDNHFVAVKQINLKGLSPQEIIEATDAFNREAQILSTLSHPLLPRIFERFSDPNHWYLVMNFIDGQTLDEYLQEYAIKALPARTGLPLAETLAIGLQLCDVLHYLHSQQPPVIFRDLKPGNIMRTTRGHLYLIDFGIARRFKPGQAKDTIPFGSPGFAAPEQYGRAQTTPQADIYSLGALLYCLLSDDDPSEHPFQFPPLRLHKGEGLRELEALIQRMVALEPAQRPADIQEVQSALQNIKHIHAAGQNAIWLPPPGQTPPVPTSFGAAQQHFFSPPSSTKNATGKITRRIVVAGSVVAGGTIFLGALATTLLRQNHDASSVSPAVATAIVQNAIATDTAQAQATVPPDGPTYWSPDLSHSAVINTGQRQVDLYDTQSKQLLRTIKPAANLTATNFSSTPVQWSPDNSKIWLVLGTDVAIVVVWEVKSGQQLFAFSLTSWNLLAAIWSPAGKYLAIAYTDDSNFDDTSSQLVILQASDGKRLFHTSINDTITNSTQWWSLTSNPVNTLAWSTDSKYLLYPDKTFAEVSANSSWSATIWQTNPFQPVNTLTIPIPWSIGQTLLSDTSLYISWSPSGNTIAIYYGKRIWICSPTNMKSTYPLTSMNYGELNYGPIWSPNEKSLAMLLDGRLAVLNVVNGQTVWCINTDPPASSNLVACAWAGNSQNLTAADNNNSVSHWSVG